MAQNQEFFPPKSRTVAGTRKTSVTQFPFEFYFININ